MLHTNFSLLKHGSLLGAYASYLLILGLTVILAPIGLRAGLVEVALTGALNMENYSMGKSDHLMLTLEEPQNKLTYYGAGLLLHSKIFYGLGLMVLGEMSMGKSNFKLNLVSKSSTKDEPSVPVLQEQAQNNSTTDKQEKILPSAATTKAEKTLTPPQNKNLNSQTTNTPTTTGISGTVTPKNIEDASTLLEKILNSPTSLTADTSHVVQPQEENNRNYLEVNKELSIILGLTYELLLTNLTQSLKLETMVFIGMELAKNTLDTNHMVQAARQEKQSYYNFNPAFGLRLRSSLDLLCFSFNIFYLWGLEVKSIHLFTSNLQNITFRSGGVKIDCGIGVVL